MPQPSSQSLTVKYGGWRVMSQQECQAAICCRGKAKAFPPSPSRYAVISGSCRYLMPADRWPERGTSHLPLGRQSLGTRCQHSSRQLSCRGTPGHSAAGRHGEREKTDGDVTCCARLLYPTGLFFPLKSRPDSNYWASVVNSYFLSSTNWTVDKHVIFIGVYNDSMFELGSRRTL